MDLSEVEAFFRHVAEYYAPEPRKMDFVWHGGEPLLHEFSYYERIFDLQSRHLDAVGIPFRNSIQTNLAVLQPATIEFLRDNFEHIGVSVDLFGDLRLTAGGRPSQHRVLENMQRLLDAGVRFGCITVLSAATAPLVGAIFEFFCELDLAFRLLPIYRTGFPGQHDEFGLTDEQIVQAFRTVADLWFEMDSDIQIRPIQDYVMNVLRSYAGNHLCRNIYAQDDSEILFIVDTDGGVYSNADAYDRKFCYGNIFRRPLRELFASPAYRLTVSARKRRMQLTCATCEFYGACSGFFMGEATPEQRYLDDRGALKCAIALPLHRYIEQKLAQRGIIDLRTRTVDRSQLPTAQAVSSEALEF